VIFKRRDPKTYLRAVVEFLWPRGGWTRAFHYVRHRLRRLPDSPERIARGIWAGVFAAFTPFYTLHFFIAIFTAKVMRGNMLASLMGTFFGNPLTYVPIAVASLQTGHWLLGTEMEANAHRSFGGKFADAAWDLGHNLKAVWMGQETDWRGISVFYFEIFFPYMIGGIIPGIVVGTICYYISVPLIRAYQHRRKGVIKAKFEALKAKAAAKADAKRKAEDATAQEK
jgi:uncharacterized protein (DUF2062 family)|tara:strand:- start:1523 stop:2200 length:678 start_codon:yes stop_codon:yes gene_type:complete